MTRKLTQQQIVNRVTGTKVTNWGNFGVLLMEAAKAKEARQ